ncbi:transporter [Pseudoroseomonas deserti]|uniref:Transporter n=1 Tax=Teichococcus deserti TaxID=1817963 RepID=A0A1V2H3U6_9PROT|nr:tripartite tricarboxylate transporter substrate-binding protein [Pseudoroseomonas deserti]ONG54802.1 transporter [Pseudoroseomonas deserti]
MSNAISRRGVMAAGLALAPMGLRAQEGNFPTRPVTLINAYPPGGVTDTATRVLAERMGQVLGQNVVVDNRPGGATSPASTAVATAKPDGYTLLMGSPTLAINPALQPALTPRAPQKELVAIAMGYRTPMVLHLHPSVPAKTLPEFIAYAKAHLGEINFGSSGIGAVNHLCMELLRARTGLDMVHVPYRGGVQALMDLRSGRLQAMFSAALEAAPPITEGVTRGLAVSSAQRLALLPDLPPVGETVPGFDVAFWQGLFAPAGTPAPVLARLEAAMLAATRDQALVQRLATQGVSVLPEDGAQLTALLARETTTWSTLIRDAGIRPE